MQRRASPLCEFGGDFAPELPKEEKGSASLFEIPTFFLVQVSLFGAAPHLLPFFMLITDGARETAAAGVEHSITHES